MQKRLDNERGRADHLQVSLNTKELELLKCKEILTVANKQIRHLDLRVNELKTKKNKLKECLKEYANVKKSTPAPKEPAQRVVPRQQEVTQSVPNSAKAGKPFLHI